MHLGNIPDMRERFGVPVGLSDHSFGSIGAVVAVSLGARVIEKHVKIDGIESADSAFSMTMDDFAQMIKDANAACSISKGPDYTLSPKEQASTAFRRSLFAISDINPGDVITSENVRSIRPGYGIAPKNLYSMLGRKATMGIKRGEPITPEFLESLE
jgi:sialic acid synthase SpsE